MLQEASRQYYLSEGRYLTRADDTEARQVCVIHEEFALLRGLSVGDTLTLTVREIGKILHYGYVVEDGPFGSHWPEKDKSDWHDLPTYQLSLEIVGTYGVFQTGSTADHPTGLNTTIFIPDTILPGNFGQWDFVDAGLYSFLLKDSRNQAAFVAEYTPLLEEKGIRPEFVQNGAEAYWTAADRINQSLLLNLLISIAGALTGLLLVSFTYLRVIRREIAIARALGAPAQKTRSSALWPGILVCLLGIAVGGSFSWNYAVEKAGRILSDVPVKDVSPAVTASPLWPVLFCTCLLALSFAMLYAGVWYTSRRPVLWLLQGTRGRNRRRKKSASSPVNVDMPYSAATAAVSFTYRFPRDTAAAIGGVQPIKTPMAHSLRFLWRQMYRSILKSALTVAATVALVLVQGGMFRNIEDSLAEMERLASSIPVEFELVGQNEDLFDGRFGIYEYGAKTWKPKKLTDLILGSGYIQEAELYSGLRIDQLEGVSFHYKTGRLRAAGLADPEAFFARFLSGREMTIVYEPGWDDTCFLDDWMDGRELVDIPIVLPAKFAEAYGFQSGDRINGTFSDQVNKPFLDKTVKFVVVGCLEGDDEFEEVLLPLSAVEAIHMSLYFPDPERFEGMIVKGLEELKLKAKMEYTVASFTVDPQFSTQLSDFKKQLEEWLNDPEIAGEVQVQAEDSEDIFTIPALRAVFRDEEVRLVLEPLKQTVELMQTLLSVVTAAFVFVLTGLSVLLVLLSGKEAACLRMLGATRGRIQWMLCLQQAVLCLLGLALGITASTLIYGAVTIEARVSILICGTLLFMGVLAGAGIGAIIVTGKKPMALLQTKE